MKKESNATRRSLFVYSLLFSVIFAGAILNCGCSSKSESGSEVKAENNEDSFEQAKEDLPKKSVADFLDSERDSMAGYWLFQACPLQASPRAPQQIENQYAWFILKVERKENGKYEPSIVSQRSDANITVKSFSITDSKLELELLSKLQQQPQAKQKTEISNTIFTLKGERKKNIIRTRVIAIPAIPLMVGYFDAVSKFELSQIKPETPKKGLKRFSEIANLFSQQKDPRVFEEFLFAFEDSPLAFLAITPILQRFKANKYEAKEIRKIGEQYIKFAGLWSVENRLEALQLLCFTLNNQRYHPELTILFAGRLQKELQTEKNRFQEDELKYYRKMVERIMDYAVTLQNIQHVHFGSDTERITAANALEKTLETNPFEPLVLYAMATNARKKEDHDSAIDYYTRLLVVPGLYAQLHTFLRQDGIQNPPRIDDILAKEWLRKNGTPDGLDAHKQKVYEKTIYSFAEVPGKIPTKKDQRNVLLELFTSSEYAGCLAADIATGNIGRTFPGEEVIVLRYHQHTGGANPLANTDSEARLDEYGYARTPNLLHNGKLIVNSPRSAVDAAGVYKELKKRVEESLEETTEFQIALEAKRSGDEIAVDAIARGKAIERDWCLVVVLAEERVDYKGANNLRFHEMVVRDVLTAIPGNPVQNGKLQFRRKIHVSDIKDKLNDSLISYEKESNHEFLYKPLEMKNLYVVAFVQNSKTKEVIQVSRVKVALAAKTSPPPTKNSGEPVKAQKSGIK